MIKAVIIEDEDSCIFSLNALLEEYQSEIKLMGQAKSIIEARQLIESVSPDLVFLDIELTDGTSFDLLEKINYNHLNIIFTTGHDSYAIKAFKVNAIDYLQKPIEAKMLEKAIKKVIRNKDREDFYKNVDKLLDHVKLSSLLGGKQKIEIPTDEGKQYVTISNIIRIQADGRYSRIHLNDRKELYVSKNIKEFEDQLPSTQFYRAHKSHLVNMEFVDQFIRCDGIKIRMSDGIEVPLSRRKKDEFLSLMKKYID